MKPVPLNSVPWPPAPPKLVISSWQMSTTELPDSRSCTGVVEFRPPNRCVTPHSFCRNVGGWMKPPEFGFSGVAPGELVRSMRDTWPRPVSSTWPTSSEPATDV
jgi:hypothetical protein